MHVILADDLPQVRSALRLFLEHHITRCVIEEATDANTLLAQAQAIHPDLILLDWELPGLQPPPSLQGGPRGGGIEGNPSLLAALRQNNPYLLIIVLSGQAEVHRRALAAGADAFVSKGQSPEHLLAILGKIGNGGLLKMKQELIRDWMTHEVIVVTPETTLPEAHRLMTDKQIRRLPVVKNDRLVGIITLGDVREAEPSDATSLSIWEMNYLLAQLKVERIMTRNPITISPHKRIGEAAQAMLKNKISGLPVVDETGRVVGIITESDIFRMVVKHWGALEATPELSSSWV